MKTLLASRRMFLQGAAGALSIPFLTSIAPKTALAAPSALGVRYVQWITNHGVHPQFFWPGQHPSTPFQVDGQTIADVLFRPLSDYSGPLSQILGTDFDPLRSKMNLVRGLHAIVNDNWHNNCVPTTGGTPLTDEGDASFPYSVDVILEKSTKVYPSPVSLPALRLTPGVNPSYKWGSFSWTQNGGRPFRLSAHQATLAALTAAFPNAGGTMPTKDPRRELRSLVTDMVMDDYRGLSKNPRLSSADKHSLNNYMDLVAEVQLRIRAAIPACDRPGQANETDFDALHRNAIDITVAALLCGATKVVAYGAFQGSPNSYDEETFHAWAHDDPSKHTTLQAYRYSKLADLAKKMDSFTESNGKTLLDNSLVFASNELSEPGHGGNHLRDMPVITLGGAGGALRTGNHIDYVKRPYNNMLVTLFNAMGLGTADFERNNVVGFGGYTGYLTKNVGAQYLTDAEKRKALPLLV
jgi:hypothetical protein